MKKIPQLSQYTTTDIFLMNKQEKEEYINTIIQIAKPLQGKTKHEIIDIIDNEWLFDRESLAIVINNFLDGCVTNER